MINFLDKAGVTYLVSKIKEIANNKVDKVTGKGLSTNDYSTEEKDKLAGVDVGATKNVVDSTISSTSTNAISNKAVYEALLKKASTASPSFTGNPTAPTPANGDSSTKIATTAFVNSAVGSAVAGVDAMRFKGTLGTGGTVTVLPTTYKVGDTYRVITAGTYAGQVCEIGDLVMAIESKDATNNLDTDWTVAQTNINGAITKISGTTPISVEGSGSSRTIKHSASGATAGSYTKVTIDVYGHVTGGSNPTTLSDYGITDALAAADLVAITNTEIDAMFK